jgi:hypothetical protein
MTTPTHPRRVPPDMTSRALGFVLGSVFDRLFNRIFTSHPSAYVRWSTSTYPPTGDGTDPLFGGHHRRRTVQPARDQAVWLSGGDV